MNRNDMCRFHYVVNTFDENFNPVQRKGHVEAVGEMKAIEKLIADGVVHERGYEFLRLDRKMSIEEFERTYCRGCSSLRCMGYGDETFSDGCEYAKLEYGDKMEV